MIPKVDATIMPFPGMNPYLEHPALWEGVHSRLVVAIADQLQPQLDPRYIASVEERVFIEGPQQRIPDVWTQQTPDETSPIPAADADVDVGVVVEVEELEIHQKRIEILDAYNEMKLVTLVEVLSPTNKRNGPGRESYLKKQREILEQDCHLVEIDLLRTGKRTLSIPAWRLEAMDSFHYVVCVSRWQQRHRFVLYPRQLTERLPRVSIPLADPDPDVPLDVQSVLEQVYFKGRYGRRLRYDQPCDPSLDDELQSWASDQLRNQSEK